MTNTRTLAKLIATADTTWQKARTLGCVDAHNRGEFFKVLRDQRALRDVPCKMAGEASRAYIRRLQGGGWLH